MSFEKAIKSGKEKRKSFIGTNKYYASSCCNHGNCTFCRDNRLHKFRDKHPPEKSEIEKYFKKI